MNEHEYENEKELIDYLNVLWRRKWLIILPTFIIVVLVAIYSLTLPKAWEIDAIIQPSKFFVQTEGGQYQEVVVVDPKQIAGQINQKTYHSLIAAELNIDPRKFPKLEAENLKDTNLVRVSIKENDVEKTRNILLSLFQHLKRELDKKIDVEIMGLETQVESRKTQIKSKEVEIKNQENAIELKKLLIEDRKNEIKTKQNRIKDKENFIKMKENAIKQKNLNIESKEIEKKQLDEEINSLKNKFRISEDREKSLSEEMKEVKGRIDTIEEEQRRVLKEGNDKNALSILLYSNEIQNNFRYYNTLDEKLTAEKVNQENINLSIEEKKQAIKQIDNQIEQIHTQIDDIRTEIENINTEIDDLHTQIDDIKNDIGKINNEIDTIKNQITIKNNEIQDIRNDMTLLEERKGRIDFAQLIKEPTSSLYPVSPKKIQMGMIAGFISLMIFTILAFFFEYIKGYKSSQEYVSKSAK